MAREKSIKIRLNDDEYDFVKGVADEFNSTISHYVRFLIRQDMGLENLEEEQKLDDDGYDPNYDPDEKYRGKTKDCLTCIYDDCEGSSPCNICTDDYPEWVGK